MAKHLEDCPECRSELEKLALLSNSFDGFVEESEKSLADSVVSVIRGEKIKKTPFFIRHIGLAASLVLILVLVVYTRAFPYGAKGDNTEACAPERETVTLEAEILDIKNNADLKGDFQFAMSDTSSYDEGRAEETAPESPAESEEPMSEPMCSQPVKSESFKDIQNESPVSNECDSVIEYAFLEDCSSLAISILSTEFEVEQVDDTTLHIKTDKLERVRALVGDKYNVYAENGVVVVKIK